jgi:hypothetical protein
MRAIALTLGMLLSVPAAQASSRRPVAAKPASRTKRLIRTGGRAAARVGMLGAGVAMFSGGVSMAHTDPATGGALALGGMNLAITSLMPLTPRRLAAHLGLTALSTLGGRLMGEAAPDSGLGMVGLATGYATTAANAGIGLFTWLWGRDR